MVYSTEFDKKIGRLIKLNLYENITLCKKKMKFYIFNNNFLKFRSQIANTYKGLMDITIP